MGGNCDEVRASAHGLCPPTSMAASAAQSLLISAGAWTPDATITEWDAPHRFIKEGSWGPNAPNVATEWIVEARAGGTCLVRVVHSLFAETDDWDDQLTGIESGWPPFFSILRLYLEHFAGQPSSQIQLLAMPAACGAWEKLAGALNLVGAAPGERRDAGDGAPPLRRHRGKQ